MSPLTSFLLIAGGLIFAVVALYLLWRVGVQPWVEKVSNYLSARGWFQ